MNNNLPWESPQTDRLPVKPGKRSYEQIPCLVITSFGFVILQWNCEHKCWDDESGDDYVCDAMEVNYYIPLTEIPIPDGE